MSCLQCTDKCAPRGTSKGSHPCILRYLQAPFYAPPSMGQLPASVQRMPRADDNTKCMARQSPDGPSAHICGSTRNAMKSALLTFFGNDAPAPLPNPAKGFLFGPAPPGLRHRPPSKLRSMLGTQLLFYFQNECSPHDHWMLIIWAARGFGHTPTGLRNLGNNLILHPDPEP